MLRRMSALADRDGLTHYTMLKEKITMTREEYYEAVLISFDQGAASNPTNTPPLVRVAAAFSPVFAVLCVILAILAFR